MVGASGCAVLFFLHVLTGRDDRLKWAAHCSLRMQRSWFFGCGLHEESDLQS